MNVRTMWPYPKVIAHRGGGTLAPENTIAAMRCGLEYGFRAVEFDVMLSRDAIPVAMHDPHFGRTVRGAGNVFDFNADQLLAMDAGTWFGPGFAGEPVAAFQQILDFCSSNGIWMNIEIKPAPGFERETGTVVAEMTRRYFAADIAAGSAAGPAGGIDPSLPLFSSFSLDALVAAKAAAPEIPRGYLVDRIPADWRSRLAELDAIALHTNHKQLSPGQAKEITQAGYGLFCYTVNTPERAREILSWGVDAFCTDRIDLIGADFC
jgi:glycerophosphoryl diester phosphodiesterase